MNIEWVIISIVGLIFGLSQLYFKRILKRKEHFERGMLSYVFIQGGIIAVSLLTLVQM